MTKLISLVLVSIIITGCAISTERREEISLEKVRKRAAFDMNCKARKIKVQKIDGAAFGARGCGKKATYIIDGLSCGHPNVKESHFIKACSAVLK